MLRTLPDDMKYQTTQPDLVLEFAGRNADQSVAALIIRHAIAGSST
jgi:hypothetical protein